MTIIDISYEGELRTRCIGRQGADVILTDAPIDNHGKGEHFSPTDLLAVSLGSCVLTLMGIAAQRLKVDISGIRLSIEKKMKLAPYRMIDKLILHVVCPRGFDREIIEQLEKAGHGCPVHHSLHPDIVQEMHFQWGYGQL